MENIFSVAHAPLSKGWKPLWKLLATCNAYLFIFSKADAAAEKKVLKQNEMSREL